MSASEDAARLRTILKQLRCVALAGEMARELLAAMMRVLTADVEVRFAAEEREELMRMAVVPDAADEALSNEAALWTSLMMMVERSVELGVLSPAQAIAMRTLRAAALAAATEADDDDGGGADDGQGSWALVSDDASSSWAGVSDDAVDDGGGGGGVTAAAPDEKEVLLASLRAAVEATRARHGEAVQELGSESWVRALDPEGVGGPAARFGFCVAAHGLVLRVVPRLLEAGGSGGDAVVVGEVGEGGEGGGDGVGGARVGREHGPGGGGGKRGGNDAGGAGGVEGVSGVWQRAAARYWRWRGWRRWGGRRTSWAGARPGRWWRETWWERRRCGRRSWRGWWRSGARRR